MTTNPQSHGLNTFCSGGLAIVYDIFLSNKSGEPELVVVGPWVPSLVNHKDIHIFDGDQRLRPQVVPDPHNHTYLARAPVPRKAEYEIRIVHRDDAETFLIGPHSLLQGNALSTVFKDENQMIEPWVDHHRNVGFEKFFLYNNNPANRDCYERLREKYQDAVCLVDWPFPYKLLESGYSGQTTQQNHTIWKYNDLSLLGLIDLDEYIVPKREPLEIPEGYCGLSIQSYWFGCSHGTRYHEGDFAARLVRRKRTSEGPRSRHKSIIKPAFVWMFAVHSVLRSSLPVKECPIELAQLNHYLTLSGKGRRCHCEIHDEVLDRSILEYLGD